MKTAFRTKIFKSKDGKRLAVVMPNGDLHLNNAYAGRYDSVAEARIAAKQFVAQKATHKPTVA